MLYLSLRAGQGGGEGGGRRSRPGDTPPRRHGAAPGLAGGGHPARPARGEAAPNPERGTRPRPARGCRAAAQPRPPRGAATRAQFPETQIPERTHPRRHHVREHTSMFTRGRLVHTDTLQGRTPALTSTHTYGPPANSYTGGRRDTRGAPGPGEESQIDTPAPRPKHDLPEESSRI